MRIKAKPLAPGKAFQLGANIRRIGKFSGIWGRWNPLEFGLSRADSDVPNGL